jgi:hypothetical protein
LTEPFTSPRGTGSAICTVSTRSHLGFALALLRSAQVHAPRAGRFLLLVDDPEGAVDLGPLAKILRPHDIVGTDLFAELVYKYNAAELCFALKPPLLARLLELGFDQAHYLDGDTWLVGDFELVERRLRNANIQLTPHLRAPLPLDGRNPTELSLLRAGTYNAGYVGVARSDVARRFLDWWAQRVRRWGINEPRFGMSGDQKWLDPVPNLFPGVVINPDPGVNAAYWNLSGHRLERRGTAVTVDGQPLVLLHLSGFDPDVPDILSKFQNRIDSTHHAIIANLLHSYAKEVLASEHRRWTAQPYAYKRWWHNRFLPVRVARALLFNYRESRVNRTAQQTPPPPIEAEAAIGAEAPARGSNHLSSEPDSVERGDASNADAKSLHAAAR